MTTTFWLRSETKKNEFRRALTPNNCLELIKAGHKVVVEDWQESIIPTQLYKEVGCEITQVNSWIQAPKDAVIVGLKALKDLDEYKHTHIYFAHAYKEQDGWQELIKKFQRGGGRIIDLEFMLDKNKRRVCAFGYWAGYVGAALGALLSLSDDLEKACRELEAEKSFPSKKQLIDFIQKHTDKKTGSAIIIGSSGRSGTGAKDLLESLNWNALGWDREQTQQGGPFQEILNHDLFVNCVLAMSKQAPFINHKMINSDSTRKLKAISDVSCDPDSDCNMVPLYNKATTLCAPYLNIDNGTDHPIRLTAIDNLPSILPSESSYDFSAQLSPHLVSFNINEGALAVSLGFFKDTLLKL